MRINLCVALLPLETLLRLVIACVGVYRLKWRARVVVRLFSVFCFALRNIPSKHRSLVLEGGFIFCSGTVDYFAWRRSFAKKISRQAAGAVRWYGW